MISQTEPSATAQLNGTGLDDARLTSNLGVTISVPNEGAPIPPSITLESEKEKGPQFFLICRGRGLAHPVELAYNFLVP